MGQPRSITNLPLWAEFTLLTLAVTAISLTLGLAIRGMVGQGERSGGVELMMKTRPQPADAPRGGFQPVVDVLRAIPRAASPASVPAVKSIAPDGESAVSFDGRPLRKVREIDMTVTAYSPDEKSCGIWADGQTASGYSVWTNGMKLVAADTKLLPFGTILTVPGYNDGQPVQVLDRGGKIKGKRLDVLYPTHEIAREWGVQKLSVTVWEYAD